MNKLFEEIVEHLPVVIVSALVGGLVTLLVRYLYDRLAIRGRAAIEIIPWIQTGKAVDSGELHTQCSWDVKISNAGSASPIFISGFRLKLYYKDSDGCQFYDWIFKEQYRLEPFQEEGPIFVGLVDPHVLAKVSRGWILSGADHKWPIPFKHIKALRVFGRETVAKATTINAEIETGSFTWPVSKF